ncbi:MAG TPA: rRNA maturation RNase YbeY [Coriobacteriia bacterium]|nr:rRNA maturation RNase YbeY [Coriobacteriia bacterium]
MEINIDNRSGRELPLEHIEALAAFTIKESGLLEGFSGQQFDRIELSLSFVDTDEITKLNGEYRSKPQPTDVLSFEMDDFLELAQTDDAAANPGEGASGILLGDIVINPDVAEKHAVIEELDLEEEIWVLVIHGILHLLGYDHMEADEASIMEELEDRLFNAWLEKTERS